MPSIKKQKFKWHCKQFISSISFVENIKCLDIPNVNNPKKLPRPEKKKYNPIISERNSLGDAEYAKYNAETLQKTSPIP